MCYQSKSKLKLLELLHVWAKLLYLFFPFCEKKDIFDKKKFTWYLSKRIQLKFLFFIFLLLVNNFAHF